jgi:hypothetical protein
MPKLGSGRSCTSKWQNALLLHVDKEELREVSTTATIRLLLLDDDDDDEACFFFFILINRLLLDGQQRVPALVP